MTMHERSEEQPAASGAGPDTWRQVGTPQVPITLYRSIERVMVAAPMPGLEPDDITVEIDAGGTIRLQGDQRSAPPPSRARWSGRA